MGFGGDKIISEIAKRIPMKNLGRPSKFLGIELEYLPNGGVKLHQKEYLQNLLKRFPVSGTKISPTQSFRLSAEGEPLEAGKPYREAIGGLLWAAIMTRPDIMYGVIQLAQFSSKPMKHHWAGIEHVQWDHHNWFKYPQN